MWQLPRSLRLRITLLFGLLALLIGLPFALLVASIHHADLAGDRVATLDALAEGSTVLLRVEIEARRDEVEQLAARLGGASEDDGSLVSLAALGRYRDRYVWMGFADVKGRVRRATDGLLEGRNVSERPWFRAGRDAATVGSPQAALMLAPFLPQRMDGLEWHLFDFAAPVRNARGELLGVLGAHVDVAHVRAVVSGLDALYARRPGRQVLLVDGSEVLAFLHGSPAPDGVSIASRPLQDWGEGGRWLVASSAVARAGEDGLEGLTVLVRESAGIVAAEARVLSRTVLAATLVSALVAAVLAWLAAGRIIHPVSELTGLARTLARAGRPTGSGGIQISSSELQELADALFDLSERVAAGQAALKASDSSREEGERERDRLATLLLTDPLTGIANRRAVEYRLEGAFRQVRAGQSEAAVLLIDVDHFKQVNDSWGHAAGDLALVQVASALARTVRASDLPARFGGEEFVCLLPATRLQDALRVAEKVRSAVAAMDIPEVGRITVSVGVARLKPEDAGPEAALERADAALYAAKHAGRNRVVGPEEPDREGE